MSPATKPRHRRTIQTLLVIIIFILVGFALDVGIVSKNESDSLRTSQIEACVAVSQRSAEQINIDWVIYTADAARAAREKGPDRKISQTEATKIEQNVVGYATHHVDVSVGRMLPPYIARKVKKEGFSCRTFYDSK